MNLIIFMFHYYMCSIIYTILHYYVITPYLKKLNIKYNDNKADILSHSEQLTGRNYIMIDKYEIIMTYFIETLNDLKNELILAPIKMPLLICKDIQFLIITLNLYYKFCKQNLINNNISRKKNY